MLFVAYVFLEHTQIRRQIYYIRYYNLTVCDDIHIRILL